MMTTPHAASGNHNFILKHQFDSAEIKSKVFVYEHAVLKNQVIAIKNGDPNKCFCLGFRTIPSDSTGVPHILEHCVLSGSQKYPVKDVFSELVKGSLTTFLNAMTYSDKTLYPFATRNEKEYFNLMDVYLDLTLNPLIDRDTFMQEGWHHQKLSRDDKMEFNGIVLNEMKGAFSDPIRKMWEKISMYLIPESTYAVSSGGYPADIVDLTYEQFVDFHRTFYHPCNSAVALYGDADIEKELAALEGFFSKFQYSEIDGKVAEGHVIQETKLLEEKFSVSKAGEAKAYQGFAVYTGRLNNIEKNIAFEILTNILFNSEASPLKRAMLEAKLGSEVGCIYNDLVQTFLYLYALGAKPNQEERFLKVYRETLSKIVAEGLDKKLVEAELNTYEFDRREQSAGAKRGMDFVIEAISSHFYDLDLAETLDSVAILEKIRREALENNYFEEMIRELLLDNPASVLVTMIPAEGHVDEDEKSLREKLAAFEKTLSDEELEEIISKSKALKEKQQARNTAEQLALLPKLKLDDIRPDVKEVNLEVRQIEGVESLITENATNEIGHLSIGFDAAHLSPEELPYLTLLGQVLCEIGTHELDYMELAKEVGAYTGGFHSVYENYSRLGEPGYRPVLWFKVKAMRRHYNKMFSIINDVFSDTWFDQPEREGEIIERIFSGMQYNLSSEGYYVPLSRISAYLGEKGVYNDLVHGYTLYETINHISDGGEAGVSDFIERLEAIFKKLIRRKGMIFHLNGEGEDIAAMERFCGDFARMIPEGEVGALSGSLPSFSPNQAFTTSADVVYAGIGGNFAKAGIEYSGRFEVMRKYLDRDFLYNRIRVQGGAYGNFSRLNRFTGNLLFVSYRDPNVAKTYQAYRDIPGRLGDFDLSEEELEQIKISAYSGFDPLLSEAQKGARARDEYLRGVGREETLRTIEEILGTTRGDIKAFGEPMAALIKDSYVSAIGNAAKIEADKALFSEIISVI